MENAVHPKNQGGGFPNLSVETYLKGNASRKLLNEVTKNGQ